MEEEDNNKQIGGQQRKDITPPCKVHREYGCMFPRFTHDVSRKLLVRSDQILKLKQIPCHK